MQSAHASRRKNNLQPNAEAAAGKKGVGYQPPVLRKKSPMPCDVTMQAKSSTGQPLQGVYQFFGEGISEALQALVDNPGTTFLAAVGTAAFAGFVNYMLTPAQAPPPNRNTLEGVAQALHITPLQLANHLNSGAPGVSVVAGQAVDQNALNTAFNGLAPLIGGAVPPVLTANLNGMSNRQKADTIFARLNQYNFQYTGMAVGGYGGFLQKQGDCNTLAQMFILALQAVGIAVDANNIIDDYTPGLVARSAIHGRNERGNVQNEAFWFFHDHHWVEYGGQRYDLLFMSNQTPNTYPRLETDKKYKGVKYDVFKGGRCMIHAAEAQTKLGIQLGNGELGLVRRTVNDIEFLIRNPGLG